MTEQPNRRGYAHQAAYLSSSFACNLSIAEKEGEPAQPNRRLIREPGAGEPRPDQEAISLQARYASQERCAPLREGHTIWLGSAVTRRLQTEG